MDRGKKTKKEKVLSKYNPRDVMYMEVESFPLWDAFASSAANQAAIARNEVTSSNLRKYLKVLHEHHKAENKRMTLTAGRAALPEYLERLLALQSSSGAFESLSAVCTVLGMPHTLPWRERERDAVALTASALAKRERERETERATAVAIAVIRQHNALFDALCEAHDRACAAVRGNELVYEAKELVNEFFQTSQRDTQRDTQRETLAQSAIPRSDSAHSLSLSVSAHTFEETTHTQLPLTTKVFSLTERDAQRETESERDEPLQRVNSTLSLLTVTVDEEAVAAQRERVANIENEVISLALKLEDLVLQTADCLSRCVAAYNAAELMLDRHKVFDELTARLAEGCPPAASADTFPEAWKNTGVAGLRPTVLSLCHAIFVMTQERLVLQELLSPQGRTWRARRNVAVEREQSRSRFVLMWHGHNVCVRIVHCLDFLRKCRELCAWYGPAYYFVANPFQLPFPLFKALAELNLQQHVNDILDTQPHHRVGIMHSSERHTQWQFEQFLNDFRRRCTNLMKDWAFNWPALPELREDSVNERLAEAMLVLFVVCGESIEKSFLWEKKFMTATSSTRGQATYLVGQGNARADKPLSLPHISQRKPRVDLAAQFESLVRERRERERREEGQRDTESEKDDLLRYDPAQSTHSACSTSTHSASTLPITQQDQEDEEYREILRLHAQRAKQFFHESGGVRLADATLREPAQRNAVSAAEPFDPIAARERERQERELCAQREREKEREKERRSRGSVAASPSRRPTQRERSPSSALALGESVSAKYSLTPGARSRIAGFGALRRESSVTARKRTSALPRASQFAAKRDSEIAAKTPTPTLEPQRSQARIVS